jgi:hypothetical protein
MAFTPEKPASPSDLRAIMSNEFDEVTTIMYDSDEGIFYRLDNNWNELTQDVAFNLDLEDSKGIMVKPEFIAVFDAADKEDDAITEAEVLQYQAEGTK